MDISPLAEIARPFRELAREVARVECPAPRHRRGRDVEEAAAPCKVSAMVSV